MPLLTWVKNQRNTLVNQTYGISKFQNGSINLFTYDL